MSHEIRTPLNAILGLFHLIEIDETCSAAAREHARVGAQAAQGLLGQLVNALDLARLDSHTMSPNLLATQPAALAHHWRELLQAGRARYGGRDTQS